MQLTSTLSTIHTLLAEAVADFKNHRNVNTLCDQVRNGLFKIVEAFLAPVVEKVLCDPELLPELKAGAGKIGLRFNGYRPTSIRLLTGKSLTLQSPQIVIQTVDQDGIISKERMPIYDATMGDIDAAFDLLETYLYELNISKAGRVIFCCDGARSY
ncbi:MAG: hypothetical protein ACKVE4_06650 [Dissulfuribacterales bacterium]